MAQYLYQTFATRVEMLTEGLNAAEEKTIGDHFQYLKHLTEQGVMILVGRTQNTDPDAFGVAVFNADSDAAAEEIVRNDPAVQRGVMRPRLFPYKISLIAEANVRD